MQFSIFFFACVFWHSFGPSEEPQGMLFRILRYSSSVYRCVRLTVIIVTVLYFNKIKLLVMRDCLNVGLLFFD